MRRLLTALGLAAASSATVAQTEVRKEAPAQSGTDAVAFAELDGTIVEARAVLQQVVRRRDKQYPVRAVNDTRIVFGPSEQFHVTLTSTAHHPEGVSKGKPVTFSPRLQRPGEASDNMGGGYAVWVFNDGTLTSLRTYGKSGAFKRDVAFARKGKGLACTITEGFAWEAGKGNVTFNSPIDGLPTTIVSARQTSSSCRITKRN
jgi:hypothetical protein